MVAARKADSMNVYGAENALGQTDNAEKGTERLLSGQFRALTLAWVSVVPVLGYPLRRRQVYEGMPSCGQLSGQIVSPLISDTV